jgi:hypothetical protein
MSPVSRGFHHHAPAAEQTRVPPGQYVTDGFPVLSAGDPAHAAGTAGHQGSPCAASRAAAWSHQSSPLCGC